MIYCGDAVEWARNYTGPKFMALLSDPPYHLTSITERFGKPGSAPAQEGTDGAYRRMSKGFMNSTWDGGDVAFQPETWAAFKRVLYPGAFIMAFAGSRGYHRMACAIEDAGFNILPAIGWVFASGFPKATRIDNQIDRDAGIERDVLGVSVGAASSRTAALGPFASRFATTRPQSDLARAWSGHRYGGQVLKPAFEFICVAQVPYSGRPLDCIVRTGAGALNIDKGRIGTQSRTVTRGNGSADDIFGNGGELVRLQEYGGRWPANFIVGDEEAARMLDRQSGTLTSGKPCGARNAQTGFASGITPGMPLSGFGDTGGSSRFFFNVATAIDEADPVLYCAKAGTVQRESGLDGFSQQENVDWPQGLVQGAASGALPRANNHACVKPLSLCKHLADLLSPPPEYGPRRLFVPFSGSGSEMCGAMLSQGWEEINGVEQDAGYCKIAEARVSFWSNNQGLFASLSDDAPSAAPAPAAAGNLFAEDDGEEDSNE